MSFWIKRLRVWLGVQVYVSVRRACTQVYRGSCEGARTRVCVSGGVGEECAGAGPQSEDQTG